MLGKKGRKKIKPKRVNSLYILVYIKVILLYSYFLTQFVNVKIVWSDIYGISVSNPKGNFTLYIS